MTQIKVSVIIPVYNAEFFLHDCVKSLTNQTLQECEFIFINDGSFDRSLEIIESYQVFDKRIRIINQENAGRSIARNVGILEAKGKYIGFIDSDDFVADEMFETLYDRVSKENTDLVVSNFFLGRDKKYVLKKEIFPTDIIYYQEYIRQNIISNLLEREDLFSVWNKLYKRDLILNHKVTFPSIYEEDQLFNLLAFNAASNVLFIDYSGYFYREVFNGVSKNLFKVDYFEIARQKLHLNYKERCNLSLSEEEINRLKAVRFVQKVFYLIFKYAILNVSFKEKFEKIKSIAFDPEVINVSKKYSKDILKNQGVFESLVLKSIKNKSAAGLYLLVLAVKFVYHPKISEVVRSMNNLKISKT
ncbi:glycosyltransferase [Flavobacterium sp.]|uniref:glycosyltransferase n=1 Tax=Flavobacterium sp. TaxID=239 RepID=UPI0025C62C0B|nr:glycosyltransferase [Flavobacterium sp.]